MLYAWSSGDRLSSGSASDRQPSIGIACHQHPNSRLRRHRLPLTLSMRRWLSWALLDFQMAWITRSRSRHDPLAMIPRRHPGRRQRLCSKALARYLWSCSSSPAGRRITDSDARDPGFHSSEHSQSCGRPGFSMNNPIALISLELLAAIGIVVDDAVVVVENVQRWIGEEESHARARPARLQGNGGSDARGDRHRRSGLSPQYLSESRSSRESRDSFIGSSACALKRSPSLLLSANFNSLTLRSRIGGVAASTEGRQAGLWFAITLQRTAPAYG